MQINYKILRLLK